MQNLLYYCRKIWTDISYNNSKSILYTAKYRRTDKVHYYLEKIEVFMSVLHDMMSNIDKMYEKLSDIMQKLETMRHMYYTNGE